MESNRNLHLQNALCFQSFHSLNPHLVFLSFPGDKEQSTALESQGKRAAQEPWGLWNIFLTPGPVVSVNTFLVTFNESKHSRHFVSRWCSHIYVYSHSVSRPLHLITWSAFPCSSFQLLAALILS